MNIDVLTFTDTYSPSINGVTYTIKAWRKRWEAKNGRMDVVYPKHPNYSPESGEFPIKSIRFPFYEEFQLGIPLLPDNLPSADITHINGQFTVGLAGIRYAKKEDIPIIASHHMFGEDYSSYLAPNRWIERFIYNTTQRYENYFYRKADIVTVPSEETKKRMTNELNIESKIEIVPNGIDTDFFSPKDPSDFLDRYDIETNKPIVGYTGRQGYEKELFDILEAVEGCDVTVLMGGHGPAHEELVRKGNEKEIDIHFTGFLERSEVPELLSALNVFLFPSPIETQGLVALEAFSCGTPVVGVDSGALSETIDDGHTGYLYSPEKIKDFKSKILKAIDNYESIRNNCLNKRCELSIGNSVNELSEVYSKLLTKN